MRYRAMQLRGGDTPRNLLSAVESIGAIRAGAGFTWIDVEGHDPEGLAALEALDFDNLSVTTALDDDQAPPKAVRYDDYLFVLIHGIDYYSESESLEVVELGLFLGSNYIVTCHQVPVDAIEHVWQQVQEDREHNGRRGADFLAHAIAATLVSNIEPAVEQLAVVVERMEEEIIDDPRRVHLDVLNQIKRSSARLNRLMQPERLTLRRLPERGSGVISPAAAFYFHDLADDTESLESIVADLGEQANIAFSTYLSVVSIRQNENVRVLSILASVFLPLTLLVGIYGMNFENMPELDSEYGYFVVLGVIVAALTGMTIWILITQRGFRREATMALTRLLVVEPRRVSGYGAALARWPRRIANEVVPGRSDEREPRSRRRS